jgi:4-amino-4-deoxy-L-arabinose transferase-like glycosyltransferase
VLLWGVVGTWCVGYSLYPIFLPHYFLPLAPVVAVLVMAGLKQTALALPWAGRLWHGLCVAGVLVGLTAFSAKPYTAGMDRPQWDAIRQAVETVQAEGERAVILFHQPESDWFVEPVYNVATARPEDARVIRANDLGPRNVELFEYFASRQPDRIVWRYDVDADELRRLGPVGNLR